jgi:hypothetical protein
MALKDGRISDAKTSFVGYAEKPVCNSGNGRYVSTDLLCGEIL